MNVTPADDLRLMWSLSEQPVGASLLTYRPNDREDGYFLLLASPEVKATLARAGFEGFSSSPEELDDFIKLQLGKWKTMVNDAGIQPE